MDRLFFEKDNGIGLVKQWAGEMISWRNRTTIGVRWTLGFTVMCAYVKKQRKRGSEDNRDEQWLDMSVQGVLHLSMTETKVLN